MPLPAGDELAYLAQATDDHHPSGDSPFTFVSTANAAVLRGAVPAFIDTRPDTLNIDQRLIEDVVREL